MVNMILLGIGAYLVNVYVAASLLMVRIGPLAYMGPRDTLPEPSVIRARALKSANNFAENLPIFLALGILALVVEGTDMGLALLGAQIFVISRLLYMLVYMSGLPVVRSLVFTAGAAGLAMMAIALF
ncbi:MAG: MAPEG family protein [Pseudomonadota bacterium]